MAGLQPTIATKSLLTWKPLLTSKFDTAANKQCTIYILISGRLSALVMNSNVWPFAVASQRRTATVPPCGRLSAQPSRTMRNYLDPKANETLPIRFYYMASVNIQYLFTDCVSYKSICGVTTSTAKYAKHR